MKRVVINLLETPASTDPAQRAEAHHLIDMLRETAEHFFVPDAAVLARRVADQIEAQVGPKTPPRPEEPTGLGAVVEDAEGKKWMRHEHDSGRLDKKHAWYPAGYVSNSVRVTYADIAAVRVLSEGVTQ